MLYLYCRVPFCAFRVESHRRFRGTYPVPPHATVFGALMSFCGVTGSESFLGSEIAIGVKRFGKESVLLRKGRREPQNSKTDAPPEHYTPDRQCVLTGLELYFAIEDGNAQASLCETVRHAYEHPEEITRYGGFSLGESGHLIQEFRLLGGEPDCLKVVAPNPKGTLALPVYNDRRFVTHQTYTRRFNLEAGRLSESLVAIGPYVDEESRSSLCRGVC